MVLAVLREPLRNHSDVPTWPSKGQAAKLHLNRSQSVFSTFSTQSVFYTERVSAATLFSVCFSMFGSPLNTCFGDCWKLATKTSQRVWKSYQLVSLRAHSYKQIALKCYLHVMLQKVGTLVVRSEKNTELFTGPADFYQQSGTSLSTLRCPDVDLGIAPASGRPQ